MHPTKQEVHPTFRPMHPTCRIVSKWPTFSKTFWKVSELPSAVQTLFLFSLEPIGFAQPSDKWQPPVPQTAGPGVIGFIAKFC